MKILKENLLSLLLFFLVIAIPFVSQAQSEAHFRNILDQPIVSVEVEGNKLVPRDQILEVLSTKTGEALEEAKLNRDLHSIYDLGFFTDVKAEKVKTEKGLKLLFLVVENPIVQQIEIQGNSIVQSSKLFSLMKTTSGKILNTRTLYGDVLVINQYYENQGYTDPSNHVVDLSWSKEGKVGLKIQEGIVIREIQVHGNTVYPEARIRSLVKTKVGDVFNRKSIEADLGNVANLYKDDDYILTGLKGNIKPDGIVIVDITETHVESMRVEGNLKTKDYVIYRHIKSKVGDVLRSKRIQKDIERLNNTGYFEKVNVDPEEGTEPGKVALVWKIKEQKTGTASLGLGYSGGGGSNRGGLTGAVSVSERNIKGTGQAAYIQWQRGVFVNSFSIGYQNPWIDKQEDSVSVSFFNSNFFNQNQVIPGTNPPQFSKFSDRRVGGSLTVGRPVFDEDTRVFVTFKHESISTSGVLSLFLPVQSTAVAGSVNSLAPAITRDTRDDVFDTSKGDFYSASYERAGPPFGGTFEFNKYQGDIRKYFPLPHNFTLAFRVLGGLGRGNVPITDWYVLGGSDTLRGYDLSRFIGTRMFLTSGELRFPLGKQKIFKGALFFDAGNAFQPGQQVSFKKLPSDYGIGIRMNLPNLGLGIIRLDFAFGGDGTRSVIGIGQSF